MSEIRELQYRSFDTLLDSVRIDLKSFASAGDIDAAELIKVAQRINYELGVKIHSLKETILEVEHFRAKLPADFHQMNLALICYQYRAIQTAPWNGNVLLEELTSPLPTNVANSQSIATQSTTVFCWSIFVPANAACECIATGDPNGFSVGVQAADGTWSVQCMPKGQTTTVCAIQLKENTPTQLTCPWQVNGIVLTKGAGCYNSNGTYTCSPPTPVSGNCDICNITHLTGTCPELVINPYPLGKCRSICNDSINIKVLQYCEAQVHCYEHFERLHIDPYTQASGFDTQPQFRGGHRGMITGNFLEIPHMECTKVYINYMGSLEDDDGNLLVLEHPLINNYYTSALKKTILENLYINGEDVLQRLQYMEKKEQEYREKALLIANMPNFRDMVNMISVIRQEHMRTYWKPMSRYYGRMGWAIPGDNFGTI